jgi:O-antigen/teichoic acid export membrane protein
MAKSTAVYLVGNLGTKLVTFFLLPVYTRFIPPADLGAYDVSTTYVLLISSVLFLDIWSGILRFMCDSDDRSQRFRTIYSGSVIFIGSAILFTVAFFIAGHMLSLRYIPLIFGYGLALCVQSLYNYVSRGLGYNTLFAMSGIVATLVNAAANIVMIVAMRVNFQSLYIAFILGILAQCVLLETKVRLVLDFSPKKIDWKQVSRLFVFALPLCVNSISYWFLGSYDRIVIQQRLGDTQNGYFTLAARFSAIISVITTCFTMAWQEVAYGRSDTSDETDRFYTDATNLYIKFLLYGGAVFISAVYFLFPIVVHISYSDAKALIPLYLLFYIASILSLFLGNILTAYKRTPTIFISTLIGSAVNVAAIYLLIGPLGTQAAGIALLLGNGTMVVIRVFNIRRRIPFRLDMKIFLYMTPLIAAVVLVYIYGSFWMNVGAFIVSSTLALLFLRPYLKMALGKGKEFIQQRKATRGRPDDAT